MEPSILTESPFGVMTFIAAPALLTNASSVLAMSTISRMLATREQMQKMYILSEAGKQPPQEAARLIEKVNRVERQAELLLHALHSIYIALGAFACATLVTLLGAGSASFPDERILHALVAFGVVLGMVGAAGLVLGCGKLFQATQISLVNIRDEAVLIRERQSP